MPNIRYPDRTCTDCGNSEEQCECNERAAAQLETKIEEMRVFYLEHGYCSCFDCLKHAPAYMLHDQIWQQLMPEHDGVRAALLQWHRANFPDNYVQIDNGQLRKKNGAATTSVRLCFRCVTKRLGRALVIEDFTDVPLNEPIHFAHRMGQSRFARQMHEAKEGA